MPFIILTGARINDLLVPFLFDTLVHLCFDSVYIDSLADFAIEIYLETVPSIVPDEHTNNNIRFASECGSI